MNATSIKQEDLANTNIFSHDDNYDEVFETRKEAAIKHSRHLQEEREAFNKITHHNVKDIYKTKMDKYSNKFKMTFCQLEKEIIFKVLSEGQKQVDAFQVVKNI